MSGAKRIVVHIHTPTAAERETERAVNAKQISDTDGEIDAMYERGLLCTPQSSNMGACPLSRKCPGCPMFSKRTDPRHSPCDLCLFLLGLSSLSLLRHPHVSLLSQQAEPAPTAPLPRCSCRWPLSRHRSWAAPRASPTSSSPGTPASSCARSASESRCVSA